MTPHAHCPLPPEPRLARLPRLSAPQLHTLAARMGDAWARLQPSRRRLVVRQLQRAYPERATAALDAIARGVFRHHAALPLEALHAHAHAPCVLDDDRLRWGSAYMLSVQGRGHLIDALDRGRGALLLSAHLGNFELALHAEALRGLPLAVVTKRLASPALDARWAHLRDRVGLMRLGDDNSLRSITEALREGRSVVMALDQHANPGHAVTVAFFGRPAQTHRGLALLSARTRTPVVPVFAARTAPGHHTLTYLPPIAPERVPGLTLRANLATLTQRYTDAIERAVRAHPDQWLWLHRRWKPRQARGAHAP